MAGNCLQPWMDRLAHTEAETLAASPRAVFGSREWDGPDLAAGTRTRSLLVNPDMAALLSLISSQVVGDPGWDSSDFDFAVASY